MSANPLEPGRHHAFPGLPRASAPTHVAPRSPSSANRLSSVTPVHASLDDTLDTIVASRDPYSMGPSIAALEAIVDAHPRHARALYELGNAHGMARDEAQARVRYEEAISAGLSGELLRRCLLRYGAVLHTLGETEQASRLIAEARERFSGPPTRQIFDAIELHMAGRSQEAFSALLEVVMESFGVSEEDRYRAAYFRALAQPE